jgi:predicted P-loop ATPase/GTPase
MKTGKKAISAASMPCWNMLIRKTNAEAACCYIISEKETNITADSVTYALPDISHKQTEDLQEMIQKILSLLNEGPLSVHEVADRLFDQKELAMQALSYLQAEEKVVQKSGKLFPALI